MKLRLREWYNQPEGTPWLVVAKVVMPGLKPRSLWLQTHMVISVLFHLCRQCICGLSVMGFWENDWASSQMSLSFQKPPAKRQPGGWSQRSLSPLLSFWLDPGCEVTTGTQGETPWRIPLTLLSPKRSEWGRARSLQHQIGEPRSEHKIFCSVVPPSSVSLSCPSKICISKCLTLKTT